ncbi:MAG: amidohydrolase [Deltaproteobacteria bacterium]|nr:MAG: amidohydrolase [Deltaproteobacteria bacterium]
MPTPVIDMWAPIVPVPEVMRHTVDNFPDAMLGYLRVFFKIEPTQDAFRARASAIATPLEGVLAALDAAGIARTLVTGFDERASCGKTFVTNELVAALAAKHPERFIPFAGADVLRGKAAVAELEHWVRDRGFRGLSLRPFMIGLPADDRHYYPFYAKCVELGVPLSIHTSANWTTTAVNDLGHPRHLDVVARDFPELAIVMSHAGYPWVLEAVLLAWKYPNVYLELAAHRPKYLAEPGTGWEPLLRFGQSTIADKVLFGTGWFLLGRPPADIVAEFRALPVKPAVMEKWLGGNAARLLGAA